MQIEQTFESEFGLQLVFSTLLASSDAPWAVSSFAPEFDYRSGRADLVALDSSGSVIAFELKLTRWREALAQAYRTRSFAHRSFVVLPYSIARQAAKFTREFQRRGVGLVGVSVDQFEVLLEPTAEEPLLRWLSDRAVAFASGLNSQDNGV